jgi:mitofusin
MSAVKTKFDQPSQRGMIMAESLRKILDDLHQRANDNKSSSERDLKSVIEKIELIEKKLQDFTKEIKDKIRQVMNEVEKNVTFTLNDEIKRIYALIDQYERPFHPEEHQINWYKKELHKFVEQKLGSNLSSRLNTALIQNLDITQKEIRAKVLDLVESQENRKMINSTLPRSDFMINFRLDCSNLCSDFREDISFHFSLGFTALMRRFSGNKQFNPNTMFAKNLFNLASSANQSSNPQDIINQKESQARSYQSDTSNLNAFSSVTSNNNDQTNNLLILLQGFQMVASRSNVVLFAVGGIVWRGLGWKILAITGSLYGLCYMYERLMWTRKTQEKLFKKQYADYASSKLRLIIDLTSQNAAGQCQQELSMYFAQMCRYIDITRDDYFEEMKKHEASIKSLSLLLSQSKILKNKGKYIHDDFSNFTKEYLQKQLS